MIMNTSRKYNVVIDRGICAAGLGKSSVDAINGVDKNIISRYLLRSAVEAEGALDMKAKALKKNSFNSATGERYSAAADCHRVLEDEGKDGIKSVGLKYEKRQKERGINQRYWEVRGLDEKLLQSKCVTIQISEARFTSKDIHH